MEAATKREAVVKEISNKKREKFVHLAESRTINAIRAIRVIGKLGNKSHYQYDESDVRKIVNTLNKEVEALRSRMTEVQHGVVSLAGRSRWSYLAGGCIQEIPGAAIPRAPESSLLADVLAAKRHGTRSQAALGRGGRPTCRRAVRSR